MSQAQKRVQKWNDDISNFQYKWLIGMDASRNLRGTIGSLSVHAQ